MGGEREGIDSLWKGKKGKGREEERERKGNTRRKLSSISRLLLSFNSRRERTHNAKAATYASHTLSSYKQEEYKHSQSRRQQRS